MQDNINSPIIGKAGEYRVISELLMRGIVCAMVCFDDGTDLILSNGKKIGVKATHRPSNDKKSYSWRYSISIRLPEIRGIGNGLYKKKFNKSDYSGRVDYWIIWCIDDNLFYIIPNKEIKQKISIVIPTPDNLRTYKKHTIRKSTSRFEKYKDNWNQLK